MTHNEVSEDHSYGVDSSLDTGTNFNDKWFAMMINTGSENSSDLSVLPWNILEDSPNPELCQDIMKFITENNSDISPDMASGYQNALNAINFPKQEVIDVDYDHQLSVEQLPVEQQEVEQLNKQYVPSSLPASQNWPGNYDFSISFSTPVKKTKGVSWVYSSISDKLYVDKDVICPINFSTNSPMPDGVNIRTMLLYSSPESASEVVTRCLDHSKQDISKNIIGAEHVVRCESLMSTYDIDPITKRHSVVVPFENPPVGQIFSTYLYKFTCFGSCPGLNRRPLMLVFSLEQGNKVLGRRKLDVKICACPTRDCKADEQQPSQINPSKKRKRKEAVPLIEALGVSGTSTSSKRAKTAPNQEGFYQLNVKDHKCYEFLKHMKQFYEIISVIKNMPPDVRRVLDEYQKRKGYNLNL